ncbi:MAG: recombinase family protein [Clostridia bacterium]
MKEKYTVLYLRLSQEDERQGESNSIQNQKQMLEKYAKDNGFTNIIIKSDDGFSGTSFIRPAWMEVMNMIETNQVSTLIVKDMSRLGREYLQVGKLMEIDFPTYGVRFIAINDGVDSAKGDNEFTPFKNIINEWYAKDCSKKIKAVKQSQAERGERVGTRAPYGYMKKPENPKALVLNPDTAETVKLIFKLCASGIGITQISNILASKEIETPSYYYYAQTGARLANCDLEHPFHWSPKTVAGILSNEVYLGHTVNLQYTTVSYKNKKRVTRPLEEQVRFENTHEALVSKEIWETAQKVRENRHRRTKKEPVSNMFSGLIFCDKCGKKLNYTKPEKASSSFSCSTNRKYGKDECTSHRILENHLKIIILDEVKRVTHFARQDTDKFIQAVADKSNSESKNELTTLTKQLDKLTRRSSELEKLYIKIYEDKALEKISEEQFQILWNSHATEQSEINSKLPIIERQIATLKNKMCDTEQFIEKAKKYTDMTKLTGEILRAFIDKIVVGERDKTTKKQEIWIYYNHIGLLGVKPNTQITKINQETETTDIQTAEKIAV